jgi:hypothetical protein
MADALALYEAFLGGGPLPTLAEVSERRLAAGSRFPGWARACYTWNDFLREVNLLPTEQALVLCRMLFERDVLAPGSPLEGADEVYWRSVGLSLVEYHVAVLRIAARYDWWRRARVHGVPDPAVDPPPPLLYAGAEKVEGVMKQVRRSLEHKFAARGVSRHIGLVSALLLYLLGFLAEPPAWITEGVWQDGLDVLLRGPEAALPKMLLYPGDYLNYLALDEEAARGGFFPTPLNITLFMGMLLSDAADADAGSMMMPSSVIWDDERGWQTTIPGETADKRIASLCRSVMDPCVGTGNMIWGQFNTAVVGEFTDINSTLVSACRAMLAMYCPWLTNSVFCVNALAPLAEVDSAVARQRQEYLLEEVRSEMSLGANLRMRMAATPEEVRAGESEVQAILQALAQDRLAEARQAYARELLEGNLDTAVAPRGLESPPARPGRRIRPADGSAPRQLSLFSGGPDG